MRYHSVAATAIVLFALASTLSAQGPPGGAGGAGFGGRGGPARGGRGGALFDPIGYWVAQITEDWKERIHPAAKGDVGSIPVSAAGGGAGPGWGSACPASR